MLFKKSLYSHKYFFVNNKILSNAEYMPISKNDLKILNNSIKNFSFRDINEFVADINSGYTLNDNVNELITKYSGEKVSSADKKMYENKMSGGSIENMFGLKHTSELSETSTEQSAGGWLDFGGKKDKSKDAKSKDSKGKNEKTAQGVLELIKKQNELLKKRESDIAKKEEEYQNLVRDLGEREKTVKDELSALQLTINKLQILKNQLEGDIKGLKTEKNRVTETVSGLDSATIKPVQSGEQTETQEQSGGSETMSEMVKRMFD